MTRCNVCGGEPSVKYTGAVYFVVCPTIGCAGHPKDGRLIYRKKTEAQAIVDWETRNAERKVQTNIEVMA